MILDPDRACGGGPEADPFAVVITHPTHFLQVQFFKFVYIICDLPTEWQYDNIYNDFSHSDHTNNTKGDIIYYEITYNDNAYDT